MKKSVKNNWVYVVLVALSVASLYFIFYYGVNVPHWDDHAIRVFVDEFSWSKIGELFNFHNEHRIAFTRLAALQSQWIFGELDFKVLMYFGQVALLGIVGWYVYLSSELKVDKVFLLIVGLFILNVSSYENSLWGMAAVQNHWVLFFAVSSLLMLVLQATSQRVSFLLAVLFSIMALFTSGNGILVAPIGLALLFFEGRKKQGFYWLGVHIAVFMIYFIGFESSETSARPHILDFFLNLFALNGSLFYPIITGRISYPKLFVLLGCINVLFSLGVFIKLFFKANGVKALLTFFALQAFFFGTLLLVAIGRNDVQRIVLLSSKYKIYSFLIFSTSLFFLFYGETILGKRKKFKWGILLFAMCVFLNTTFSNIRTIEKLNIDRNVELYNLGFMYKQNEVRSSFRPVELPFAKDLNSSNAILNRSKVDSIALTKDYIMFFETEIPLYNQSYVWIKSKENKHLIPFNDNGEAQLSLLNFESGIYEIYVLEETKQGFELFNTEKTLKINGIPYVEAPKNW